MDKAIHTTRQAHLISLLKSYRERAGLRQVDVASRLGVPQSFVSKYESGERRLDLVELQQVCEALDIALTDFIAAYVGRDRAQQ